MKQLLKGKTKGLYTLKQARDLDKQMMCQPTDTESNYKWRNIRTGSIVYFNHNPAVELYNERKEG